MTETFFQRESNAGSNSKMDKDGAALVLVPVNEPTQNGPSTEQSLKPSGWGSLRSPDASGGGGVGPHPV